MSIWDKMNDLTRGKTIEEKEEELKSKTKAQVGDTIKGTITNIVNGNATKKGGYGFIASPELPYERIFFHWSGLKQDTLRFPELKKRMRVEFQLQWNEHEGYRAIKISVIQ